MSRIPPLHHLEGDRIAREKHYQEHPKAGHAAKEDAPKKRDSLAEAMEMLRQYDEGLEPHQACEHDE